MSLGWKIACWSLIVIMVLGALNLIGLDQFEAHHVIAFALVIGVAIKCLELGKEVDNLKAKNKKFNKDKETTVTLN
jgi:hypothetical protein